MWRGCKTDSIPQLLLIWVPWTRTGAESANIFFKNVKNVYKNDHSFYCDNSNFVWFCAINCPYMCKFLYIYRQGGKNAMFGLFKGNCPTGSGGRFPQDNPLPPGERKFPKGNYSSHLAIIVSILLYAGIQHTCSKIWIWYNFYVVLCRTGMPQI